MIYYLPSCSPSGARGSFLWLARGTPALGCGQPLIRFAGAPQRVGRRCQVAFSWRKACRALSKTPTLRGDSRMTFGPMPAAIIRRSVAMLTLSSAAVSRRLRTRSGPPPPTPSSPPPRRSLREKPVDSTDMKAPSQRCRWLFYCAGKPSRGKCPQFREDEAAQRRCARRFRLVRSVEIKLANVRACCRNFALLCGRANSGCVSLRMSVHPWRSDLTRLSRFIFRYKQTKTLCFPDETVSTTAALTETPDKQGTQA